MAPMAMPVEPEQHQDSAFFKRPTPDAKAAQNGSLAAHLNSLYEVLERPIGSRRRLRVVTLGAGYSGLMMAILFNEKLKDANAELTIYERNPDLGGTWLENRYPGCKCDIPAHNYSYSFCPNPDWPNYYATSQQIFDYMKDVANKYNANDYMKFRHSVKGARWNDSKGKWQLQVEGPGGELIDDECDVFINAGGVLNNWKWPDIKGLQAFEGKLLHSARWDDTYDFTGKKVACIGIGSSGIQIVPQLAKVVASMDCYIRTQTWISPAPGINEPTANDPEMDKDYNFGPSARETFKDPEALRQYRQAIMDRRIENFKRNMANSDVQTRAQDLFRNSMRERLGDSEKGQRAADVLVPDFPVGCRRQTPGPGFLEAIVADHVELRWDDVDSITEKGIRGRDGTVREYDAIICATGFDTTFRPAFPIVGRNGVDLRERWAQEDPQAYFGICVPDMPNYFTFIGPNSPISNGSLILGIQMTAMYIYKWLTKMQTESYSSFTVRGDAVREYNEHVQKYLQRTVWTRGCRSWYKRGTVDGPVVAIYAGTSFHFMEAIKSPRFEDFEMVRVPEAGSNRFAWLGNGFTLRETKGGSVGATQTIDFDEYFNLFVTPDIHG